MNLQLLIDSIVRETTVLIAQLATAHGVRAPLAHVANQVFLDLANELNEQGVSRKVSADMFGMALRTYLRKIQRLGESATDRGRSLWEAVLAHLEQSKLVTRAEVLRKFSRDEPELVRGVLHDLCESGLVFRTGSGPTTAYRVARPEEIGQLSDAEPSAGLDELVWALVYRQGPLTHDALAALTRQRNLDAVLDRLASAGRVQTRQRDGSVEYSASEFFVPRHASVGWEAAVYDHYHALVKTIVKKLGADPDARDERVGGSTYSFDVWPGHPLEAEALEQLKSFRERTSELRERIRTHNASVERPKEYLSVTLYAGQCVVENNDNDQESS